MTVAQLETLLADRRIARHAGRCFFTVYDPDEATEWRSRGATITLRDTGRGDFWEVFPATMLDEMHEENDDGELVDTRPAFLLEYLRDRDGFDVPFNKGGR